MENTFTVNFASLNIGMECRYGMMQRLCRGYLSDLPPEFSVSVTEQSIAEEQKLAYEPITPDYAEALCLYREISEKLPFYDRLLIHGAVIAYEGKAYLFTAPSGTGKTTHIRLWQKYLGDDVEIVNGDKPIFCVRKGSIIAYGTPFAGKEGLQNNVSYPLAGICFLQQGKHNIAHRLKPDDAFLRLFLQAYKPCNKQTMMKTISLLRSFSDVPCISLSCTISETAVVKSFEALTGLSYKEKKL